MVVLIACTRMLGELAQCQTVLSLKLLFLLRRYSGIVNIISQISPKFIVFTCMKSLSYKNCYSSRWVVVIANFINFPKFIMFN